MARSIPQTNLICFVKKLAYNTNSLPPYTPQQNGVSERKNRTIMEMVRCMMDEKGLPKSFWLEATSIVVFLLNKLPLNVVKWKTPFEAWYGFKPSLQNLKIFGYIYFSLFSHGKRDKINRIVEPSIFIGYREVYN